MADEGPVTEDGLPSPQTGVIRHRSYSMLLALDTATRQLSLALHDGLSVAAEHSWRAGQHHTVELAPQAALLMRRAGVEPASLRGIAVALGPGSYTGLRIGLGLAKGLALAHNLPLVGVPTGDILMRAQAPRAHHARAVLQAGRGRVLVLPYQWNSQHERWEADGGARVLTWEALAGEIAGPTLVCGEIDEAGRDALRALKGQALLAAPAFSLRRAGFLAEIGWERIRAGQTDDPLRLAPLYGHAPEGAAA